MSVDYYLFSPSKKVRCMVGSNGFSGPKSWPTEYGGKEFIYWAIDNFVDDVVLVNENTSLFDEPGIVDFDPSAAPQGRKD